MNKDELLQLARDGDVNALEQLFTPLRQMLSNKITHMMGDPSRSEDIVQMTFVRAQLSITATKDGTLHFSSWIYTIATNLARDEMRQRQSRKTYSLEQRVARLTNHYTDTPEIGEFIGNDGIMDIMAGSVTEDPADMYERKEANDGKREFLDKALALLTPREQEILIRRSNGESYEEIALNMGTRWTVVKALLEKARSQIREYAKTQKDPPLA